MKIRLTKETLGLSVGTIIQAEHGRADDLFLNMWTYDDGNVQITVPVGSYEEIPEPSETDRLRANLYAANLQIADQAEEIQKIREALAMATQLGRNQSVESWVESKIRPTPKEYRYVGGDEEIIAGDEVIEGCGRYRPISAITPGNTPNTVGKLVRRLIQNEPTYRLLKPGEIIQEDDEYKSTNGIWNKVPIVGRCVDTLGQGLYRRRLG